MAKKRSTIIVHVGANELDLADRIKPDFKYLWQADVEQAPLKDKPLLKKGLLNSAYRNAYFLIDPTFPWLDDEEKMGLLPANQLFLLPGLKLSKPVQALMNMKGAITYDFTDVDAFSQTLAAYFFPGASGLKLDVADYVVAPTYTGSVALVGKAYSELEGDFGADWQLVTYLKNSVWIPPHLHYKFLLDFEAVKGDAELSLHIDLYDPNTGEYKDTKTLSGAELRTGVIEIDGGDKSFNAQFNIYARGTGCVHIGPVHMRRSRGPYGELLVNGQRLIPNTGMNGDLAAYFDAGDMKPPLNVYFSGYHGKESFEGNFMMRGFNSPFLLITDSRVEGGAFYLGTPELEQQVVDTIRATLKRLGFGPHDLILSGLSMGTFASLYYAGRLEPYAVVIGKPLTNLGTIASNVRIMRPMDFGTATDLLLTYGGGLDQAAIDRLNQRFWDRFKAGNYAHTTFAIAYMLNDDYDGNAFPELRAALKEKEPLVRIFSKGLPGRHNDNTGGIVAWFVMQYRHILEQGFGRTYEL